MDGKALVKGSMVEDFSQLFTSYHSRFVRFANRYVRDVSIAEDMASDAFIYYWENKSRLPEDTNVPAYILTAVKHNCLSHLRHQSIRENVTSTILSDMQWELSSRIARLEAFEPAEVFTKEIMELVKSALDSLPEQTKQIFLMSRYHYLSHKEIAEQLNISTKSVEFHITKALRLLRVELKDYYPFLWLLIFMDL